MKTDTSGVKRGAGSAEQHPIFTDIRVERLRQERLRDEGKFLHTCADPHWDMHRKLAVLMEEVGEVANVFNELPEWRPMNSADRKVLREELIQVAAVAVAWVESIDELDDTTAVKPCVNGGAV